MALAAPIQSLAHYFHASTDRFSPVAVRVITKKLHDAAAAIGFNPTLLSLTYDTHNDVFLLTCPGDVGFKLDALLLRTLRDYVSNEEVEVTRFAECLSGDPFDDYDPDVAGHEAAAPGSKPLNVHLVNFDGINTYGKVKAFRLRDLPPELSYRAKTRQKIDNIGSMITLRRVRWDEREQQHFFDSSVGEKIATLSESEDDDLSELLALLAFLPFARTDKAHRQIMQDADSTRQWEFVGPHPDSVEGWLQGQGETRQLDPNERPEMARDAIRFTGDPSTRHPTVGRLRMPKGADISALHGDQEEDDEPEKSEAQHNSAFAALMKPGAGDASESEESDDSRSSSSQGVQSFAAALRPSANEHVRAKDRQILRPGKVPEAQASAGPTKTLIKRPDSRLDVVAENDRPRPSIATPDGSSSRGPDFPAYNRNYAKIDNWGLTGDPKKWAEWQHENSSPFSSQKKRAPRTYDSTVKERAQSISNFDNPSSRLIQSTTPMTFRETVPGGDEPWANKVVKPEASVPEGELINTGGSMAGRRQFPAPRVPPGLGPPGLPSPTHFPPLGASHPVGHLSGDRTKQPAWMSSERSDSISAWSMSVANTQQSTPMTKISVPPQGPGSGSRVKHDQPLIRFENDDDDNDPPIIERLEPQNQKTQKVFRTMQQQAPRGKKHKNKTRPKKTAPGQNAVLDRPSPPPAPKKPGKDDDPAKTNAQDSSQSSPGKLVPTGLTGSEGISQTREAIVQNLPLLLSADEETALIVQFGLILLADDEALAGSNAARKPDLQEKLNAHTAKHNHAEFFTAIGRERVDGFYLLSLPEILAGAELCGLGENSLKKKYFDCSKYGLSASLTYEIDLQVPGFGEWMLKFDQEHPEEAVISPVVASKPSIYVHYPRRVWDARIRPAEAADSETGIPEPTDDLKTSMMRFIKTFNTPSWYVSADLPGFEADILDATFSVSKVLAKREFSQHMGFGSTWLVSQVWDLHLRAGSSMSAFAEDEHVMRQQGRLWWEAALQLDRVGVDGLEQMMNRIVEKLDPLGLEGLQTSARATRQSLPVVREQEYNPYW